MDRRRSSQPGLVIPHVNLPRMSAETVVKLVALKNLLTERDRSVLEESLEAGEQRVWG